MTEHVAPSTETSSRRAGRRSHPVFGPRRPGWARSLLGVVGTLGAVASATGLAWLLPHADPGVPATLYILAVIAASLLGGVWAGFLASFLSLAGLDYVFLTPRSTLFPLTAEDATLLTVFVVTAILAAAILARLQLVRRRTERERNYARAMATVARELSKAHTEGQVASAITGVASAAMGATAAGVFLLDKAGGELTFVASHGYPRDMVEEWRRFPVEAKGPAAQAVRDHGPVLLGSLAERRALYLPSGKPRMGPGASAALPLMIGETVLGSVTLQFGEDHTFGSREVDFLQAFALHCTEALERARAEERERSMRARWEFLAQSSQALASSLDYEQSLEEIARLAIPNFADCAAVELIDEAARITMVAVAHGDPELVDWARQIRGRLPPDVSAQRGVGAVIRTGQSEFYPELIQEELEGQVDSGVVREVIRKLALRSLIIVPLATRDRVLGAMTMIRSHGRALYDRDDFRVAEELGRRAAVHIENARLFADRDHVARSLQQILLPASLPGRDGFQLAASYQPSGRGMEVGGDFYDIIERPDGSFGLVVGDVCGHGPEAAAVMGVARQTIRVSGMNETRPSAILRTLNRAMIEGGYDRFVTVCDVRVQPTEGGARLTVCAAGHPLPFVVGTNGSVREVGEPGMLLGVTSDVILSDWPVDLGQGETLVLYTDGLLEWPSREPTRDAFRRLLSSLVGSSAEEFVTALEAWWRGGVGPDARDDAALVVMRASP